MKDFNHLSEKQELNKLKELNYNRLKNNKKLNQKKSFVNFLKNKSVKLHSYLF